MDMLERNQWKIVDNGNENTTYLVSKTFENNYPKGKIQEYFEHEAQIATLALIKNERNQFSGCPFFEIDWKNMKTGYILDKNYKNTDENMIFEDHLHIREFFEMAIIRNIPANEIEFFLKNRDKYTFPIGCLYLGLLSNNDEAKYFNLFIILEYIERENKHLFKNDTLFTDDEKKKIRDFASSFDSNKKKGELLKNIHKTTLNRAEKLYQYLSNINLICITNGEIILQDIADIIDQRNHLFHSGEELNKDILYMKLFPLVKEIVLKNFTSE
jgi:hypothetical protein